MEIKNLYTLKTIIEEGSFASAANKLGYTQSTITFQIRQLETELGITLFEKIGRRNILTPAGESILPYIDETLSAFERLQNVGKDLKAVTGEMNIIVSETLLCYKLDEVISEFHRIAPKMQLKLRSLSCYETKQAIIKGTADLGICYDDSAEDDRLSIYSLGHAELLLVASSKLYKELGEKLDFTQSPITLPTSFITDEPDGLFRRQFEKYVKDNQIKLESTIELWSTSTIKSLVKSGLGVAFLPDFTVQEELAAGTFVSIKHHIPCEKIRAVYLHHKNKYMSEPMKLFMSLLEQYSHI